MEQKISKIDSLTGIRAIAALWVILRHYPAYDKDLYPYSLFTFGVLSPLANRGYLGVDLFFVLSGFIIAYVYQHYFQTLEPRKVYRFLSLRLARLYPVHLAMLLVAVLNYFVLSGLSHGQLPQPKSDYLPQQLLAAVLNVHSWGFSGGNWNGPSWSISAEWFAYLMFPIATAWFWIKKNSNLWFVTGMALLLATIVYLSGLQGLDPALLHTHALIHVMVEFSLGVCTYNLYKHNTAPEKKWDYLALVLMLLCLWGVYSSPSDTLIVLLFPLFIYCLSKSMGFILNFFSHPVMVHLGEISYSVYLVHGIFLLGWVGIFIRRVLVPHNLGMPWHVLTFVVSIAVVLGCSELMYRHVEFPAREHLRKIINRKFASAS